MRRTTALIALLTTLTACTPRHQPPQEQAAPGQQTQERTVQVAEAAGFGGPFIEFATADRGYAIFTKCGPENCEAQLYGTADGARSWTRITHPQPVAKNQQMYVMTPETVLLLSEPDAWYVTHDGAASWQRSRYVDGVLPSAYRLGDGGKYYVDDSAAIRDNDDARSRREAPAGGQRLTNPPPTAPGGPLWLAGEHNGQPVTWISHTGPDGWQPVPVPKPEGRQIVSAHVAISADGKDTWLLADPAPPGGAGTALARRSVLKRTGLPLIWLLTNNSWVRLPTDRLADRPDWSYSYAPAGSGLLLLSGPDGATYLGNGIIENVPEVRPGSVGLLRDGTIAGRSQSGGVHLSTGTGMQRRWAKVVLSGRD